MSKAVILVSGGLDSTTVVAVAESQGYDCYTLSFDYGQRHRSELEAARRVTPDGSRGTQGSQTGPGQHGGSALTDTTIDVPEEETTGIPVTYAGAQHSISPSPSAGPKCLAPMIFSRRQRRGLLHADCRPEYVSAFEAVANLATKSAVEGQKLTVHAPLIDMTKGQIIRAGLKLDVDYSQTVSCYKASLEGLACGRCESCRLRRRGFEQAGIEPHQISK